MFTAKNAFLAMFYLVLWPVRVYAATAEAMPGTFSLSAEDMMEEAMNGESAKNQQEGYSIQALVDWIRSVPGGFVHEGLDITFDGIFVKDSNNGINPNELLMSIPHECIIHGNPSEAFEGMQCDTIRTMNLEIQHGNESSYGPYVDFFLESTERVPGIIPSLYSEPGQALVRNIVGGTAHGSDQQLPPEDITGWIEYEYVRGCQGSTENDSGEHTVAGWVVARSWGEKLIPLMDIMNHHRTTANTKNNIKEGRYEPHVQDVHVFASRAIEPGEELFTNFGRIDTLDLFRDCGYVEDYPHEYQLPGPISISLSETNVDGSSGLIMEWLEAPPENVEMFKEFYEAELERLQTVMYEAMDVMPTLPEHEAMMIEQFGLTYITALSALVYQLDQGEEGNKKECSGGEDTCVIDSSRYSPLVEAFDDLFTTVDTCDQEAELDLSHHNVIYEVKSPYQHIAFDQDPQNNNTCFMLDNIYQICTSYRPHYHEMMVHYSARFLKEVKRVIFIGGGDSMLLHEVIKYPSLELVIGLELDQIVTRTSFKYFGSQPHWDNEKVQWWYGDAAKSLLMLPKEYFGTFDLVLVDLSETVMSNTVTKGLNIMSALSLLLKEDGIFLKNEMYFHSLSKVFKHTIQLHYYGVPLVCSQCMVLGSNKINFIETDLMDHEVSTIHEPSIHPDREFQYVHDYMNNPAFERHCRSENDDDEQPAEQERSPGIIMILEAENSNQKLDSANSVQSSVESAVQYAGLSLEDTVVTEKDDNRVIVTTVFKEGYIVARSNPSKLYVALDIHLWSSFEKIESAKTALLDTFSCEATDASSFRIVAPGLFGVSTWKEDEKKRGPRFSQDCKNEFATKRGTGIVDETAVLAIVEESINKLLLEKDAVFAIICGSIDEPCNTIEVLEKHDAVGQVIPLWACSYIQGDIEYLSDADTRKLNCENEIRSVMAEAQKSIRGVVVDPSTSFAMAQIMYTIMGDLKKNGGAISADMLAIAPSLDPSESWRKIFVDQLRDFYNREPGFKATVFFNSTESSLEVTTFSSGDLHFINNMRAATRDIEKRTGLVGEIRHFGGVEYTMQDPFEPPQFFLHDAYDQTAGYEQWKSQEPDGHQVVYQFEFRLGRLSREKITEMAGKAFSSLELDVEMKEYTGLGDGIVIVAVWSRGNIVLIWDGRKLVGVNLFMYEEQTGFVEIFGDAFTRQGLKRALVDEMPRGRGRVVNFKKDLEPRLDPAWAMVLQGKV